MICIGLGAFAQTYEQKRAAADEMLNTYQYNQAISLLKELMELQPGDRSWGFKLGGAYEKTGQLSKAKVLYQEMLQKDTSDIEILMRLGKLHAKVNNLNEAYTCFRQLTILDPENAYFQKLAGQVAEEIPERAILAISHYEQSLKLNAGDEEVIICLAEIYLKFQQTDRARTLSRTALEQAGLE